MNPSLVSLPLRYSGENLISQSQIRQGDLLTATVDRDRVEEVERQITQAQQVSSTCQEARNIFVSVES